METTPKKLGTRVVDLVVSVGKVRRGADCVPAEAGKTSCCSPLRTRLP